MDTATTPFFPPAPKPRTVPPSLFQMLKVIYKNPIELWGEPSYNEPYVYIRSGIGDPLLVANDPSLIKHVLVDKAANYRMAKIRQLLLRPILKDGLLTAEGEIWKRSRKAMAPVFTSRHIHGFAQSMFKSTEEFVERYKSIEGPFDMAHHMTELTFDILSETLFSKQIVGNPDTFGEQVERLFETAGRVDPLDILGAPEWVPRFTRMRARKPLAYFRKLVTHTVDQRKARIQSGEEVPDDFMTLLLKVEGPDGLTRSEIEDNVITFIGAGHETTARALGWAIYLGAAPDNSRNRLSWAVCERVV